MLTSEKDRSEFKGVPKPAHCGQSIGRFEYTFDDESNTLFIFVQETETAAGANYLAVSRPYNGGLGVTLDFEFQHGRASAANFGVGQIHQNGRRLRFAQQLIYSTCDGLREMNEIFC